MTSQPPRDPTKGDPDLSDESVTDAASAAGESPEPSRKGIAEAPQPSLADDDLARHTSGDAQETTAKEIGVSVIKKFLKTLDGSPGVYRMINAAGDVLYIGKAKNLKNRVGSYFRDAGATRKTQAMVSHITSI